MCNPNVDLLILKSIKISINLVIANKKMQILRKQSIKFDLSQIVIENGFHNKI